MTRRSTANPQLTTTQSDLIQLVLDVIDNHTRAHGKPPLLVWCSVGLFRDIVEPIRAFVPPNIGVNPARSLQGITAATILNQFGDENTYGD